MRKEGRKFFDLFEELERVFCRVDGVALVADQDAALNIAGYLRDVNTEILHARLRRRHSFYSRLDTEEEDEDSEGQLHDQKQGGDDLPAK